MDTTYGVLCLIPPIVAIGLALWTKQTIFSLFIAVWLGSTMMNGFNPLVGFVKIISDYVIPSLSGNASLIVLVTLSGGMIAMLRTTGAAEAFATKVTKVINTAKKGQVVTCLSAFIFSYTEPCLMLGTIMRPVTDMVRISRAKLAYILDSMGCNLAALSPISSYGPFITGLIAAELLAAGIEGSEWGIWLNMLPFNLYGVFAMITVLIVAAFGLNFGPMYKEEKRARETGKLLGDGIQPLVPEVKNELPQGYKLTIFWSGDLVNNGLVECFRNANITLAICIAFMGGAVGAGIMGVSTKLFSVTKAFDTFVNGMAELISVPFILVCAWSLGSIVKGMGTSEFLIHIVENYLTPGLVPALVFLFGALISFSTGSSWGVWSIMMPIAFPMAVAFDISIPFVVGAVIGGGLFGDQCSPISDTTVLSSTGASCNHVVHVMTQLPYGITVGISAFLGFLFGGLTGQYILSIVVTAVILVVVLFALTQLTKLRYPEKVH